MKTINLFLTIKIIAILSVCWADISYAQSDSVVTVSRSSKITYDLGYIGLLGNLNCYEDRQTKDVSFRAGFGASYIFKKTRIQSWTFVDYNGENFIKNIMFKVGYTLNNNASLSAGHIPTFSALMRPNPISEAGHFENWTAQQLPGVALGAGITLNDSNATLGVGIYNRLHNAELHGYVNIPGLTLVEYYNVNKKNWGAGINFRNDLVCFEGVITDSVYGVLSSVKISKEEDISIYGVLGANREKEWLKQEIGITKHFTTGNYSKFSLSGLFGIGYEHTMKMVRAYFLVHI